jgi:DNA-binding CsgD family transcriptional regulator
VHPAAAALPLMGDEGIEELARDIEANGLQEPVILWCDNTAEAKGEDGPFSTYLLDGRNRMAALERLGITNPHQAPTGQGGYEEKVRTLNAMKRVTTIGRGGKAADTWVPDTNPVTFVLSMNVHRRHLTTKQKREAIVAYIKENPTASNREVAREMKVDHKTVATVRDSGQGGEIPQNDRPADRVEAVLRSNPEMTHKEVAAAAGVSHGTVSKYRRKLEEAGEIPTREAAAQSVAPEPEAEPLEHAALAPDLDDPMDAEYREKVRALVAQGNHVLDYYDSAALTPQDIEDLRKLAQRIHSFAGGR